MFVKLLRKKFAGVQQPLGRWIVRHLLGFIVLSPAILVTWLYLKLLKYEVIIVGVSSSAISSFLVPLEPELRKRQHTNVGLSRTFVLNMSVDANLQVRKMYNEIVKIYGNENKLLRRIVYWASKFGIKVSKPAQTLSDQFWRIGSPSISLTSAVDDLGMRYLETVGVSHNKFICYATRTESYYSKLISNGVVVKPRSIRNPNEQIYLDAVSKFLDQGFSIIRMGKDLNTRLRSSDLTGVVDYATTNRTDALDCFLLNRCKFLLSGASGIVWFRNIFNLPSLICDSYDIRATHMPNEIFLFQRVCYLSSGEFATVSEMLKMRSEYSDERHQGQLGVELIKNTADEILAACNEMNSRIDGTWITTPQDEELQQRYLDLVVKYSDQPTWRGGGRVGTQFLRDNQDLLK